MRETAAKTVLTSEISRSVGRNEQGAVLGLNQALQSVGQILAPLAVRVLCVPVNSERTSEPDQLARWCKAANPAARITVE